MTSFAFSRSTVGAVLTVGLLAACGAPEAAPPVSNAVTSPQKPDAKGLIKSLNYFRGSPDGADPRSAPVFIYQGPNTNAGFGVTASGGDSNNDGTVYEITKPKSGSWTESVVYAFKGPSYTDGRGPVAIQKELDQATPELFVTTSNGGLYDIGAVVKLTQTSSKSWTEGVLYSFGLPPDAENPYGALLIDKAGNLYGTSRSGGTAGVGTVYRMQPKASGYTESVLYSFQSGTDGAYPYGSLIMDKAGALYGTTQQGGASGFGTVFKLAPTTSGYTETILHTFQGPPNDGEYPTSGLTPVTGSLDPAAGGKVIGMSSGGGNQDDGVAYELTPAGSTYAERVLWNFGSVKGDGEEPYGGVCVNKKGVIFGTTEAGGPSGLGTFFELMPSGSTYKETVYRLTGAANGANPYAGPSTDSKWNLYFTTAAGGKDNDGAVDIFSSGIRAPMVCE